MGIAFPFKSGYVDPGSSGGVTVPISITIQAAQNPTLTGRTVLNMIKSEVPGIVKTLVGD